MSATRSAWFRTATLAALVTHALLAITAASHILTAASMAAVAAKTVGAVVPTAAAQGRSVVAGRARFTVITNGLIRMEKTRGGKWDDRPTIVVITRDPSDVPPPDVNVTHGTHHDAVTISTPAVTLVYDASADTAGSSFAPDSLAVTVKGTGVTWRPGNAPAANLNGTYGSLDCYSTPAQCVAVGEAALSLGLVSRDGWAVVDDLGSVRLASAPTADGDLPWVVAPNGSDALVQDLYFLGHGREYRSALRDFAAVSGRISTPPLSAFGVWWSRYYPYSQKQFMSEVLEGYAEHGLPLNRVVLDMDWHEERHEPGCVTWGGTTWNTSLFPNPSGFVDWLHSGATPQGHSMPLALNVHPASGIDHCQSGYASAARMAGIDPSTNATVPCDMFNQTLAAALFSLYDAGANGKVDAWWTDYNGCGAPAGLNATGDEPRLLWSNALYDQHVAVRRRERPLVLSRYGGLGSQRYPIGFSGDTFQDVALLDLEIRTTPTAANVLFAYWSHDIGGFHSGKDCPGDADPANATGAELLMRWMQFGAVAPIFRTHCNHCERRAWMFPYFKEMKEAMLLRNVLAPYIYTAAREAYDTAVAPVHPMYLDSPEDDDAYTHTNQYMFGRDIVASPVSELVNRTTNTTTKSTWLPGGEWRTWAGDELHVGPTVVTAPYTRAQIPLFVRAGAVVPTKTMASVAATSPNPLVWVLAMPGTAASSPRSGGASVHEDDGVGLVDRTASATLSMAWSRSTGDGSVELTIAPVAGGYAGLPQSRNHTVQLRGVAPSSLSKSPPAATCADGAVARVRVLPSPGTITEPAGAVNIDMVDVKSAVGRTCNVRFGTAPEGR